MFQLSRKLICLATAAVLVAGCSTTNRVPSERDGKGCYAVHTMTEYGIWTTVNREVVCP